MIRRMTRISNQYGAVNLSQGFPDFEPPKEILERLAQVTKEDFHQYATTWGSQNFRDAVAAKQKHFMGYDIDPNSEIVVTCGSTEAMMAAMLSVTNPGDKVIVFSPFYENYGADAILSGAEPIYVPLVPPEYSFDADVLEAAFRQHPKALILCNPSNPCGKVFTREELQIIADLAEKYDTYVITDEVYEHILYAPNRHVYFSHPPGHEKAHDMLFFAFQDLLHHRLAPGLRYCSSGDHRPREEGSRLPDCRRRRLRSRRRRWSV